MTQEGIETPADDGPMVTVIKLPDTLRDYIVDLTTKSEELTAQIASMEHEREDLELLKIARLSGFFDGAGLDPFEHEKWGLNDDGFLVAAPD